MSANPIGAKLPRLSFSHLLVNYAPSVSHRSTSQFLEEYAGSNPVLISDIRKLGSASFFISVCFGILAIPIFNLTKNHKASTSFEEIAIVEKS